MRIECITSFLDGRERFEKGDIFTIDDAKAAYFVGNGWARDVAGGATGAAAEGATDLTIHNSTIGVGDSNG